MTDKSIEILRKTKDGNDLDPMDLSIIQSAINGNLNEKGLQYFDDLHTRVMTGQYRKPWLAGIENITRDAEGYIYWRNFEVEHFTFRGMSADEIETACKSIETKCKHLEAIGVEPSITTVIWRWEEYENRAVTV